MKPLAECPNQQKDCTEFEATGQFHTFTKYCCAFGLNLERQPNHTSSFPATIGRETWG
jgi:hypothetical protein